MKVWAFLYNPSNHESAYATVSLHITEDGAKKAMERHKNKERAEWEKMNEEYTKKHGRPYKYPFDQYKAWCVVPMEVEGNRAYPLPMSDFFQIVDLRPYLLTHPDQGMVLDSVLHYMGDEAQVAAETEMRERVNKGLKAFLEKQILEIEHQIELATTQPELVLPGLKSLKEDLEKQYDEIVKQRREQLLIEIMEGDEELGLYDLENNPFKAGEQAPDILEKMYCHTDHENCPPYLDDVDYLVYGQRGHVIPDEETATRLFNQLKSCWNDPKHPLHNS